MAESLCSGCGLSFSGLTAYDRHQRTTDTPPHVVCLDPRTVGLQAMVRTSGGRRRVVWGSPRSGSVPWEASEGQSTMGGDGSGGSGVDVKAGGGA